MSIRTLRTVEYAPGIEIVEVEVAPEAPNGLTQRARRELDGPVRRFEVHCAQCPDGFDLVDSWDEAVDAAEDHDNGEHVKGMG